MKYNPHNGKGEEMAAYYEVITIHEDEPKLNRNETVNYAGLIKIFPFISSMINFDKLSIVVGLIKYKITKL